MTTREVELSGGSPWGFRMHGGADQNQPLRISRVNPGRKAALSGIREGDVISSINGRGTKSMSNAEAHAMLKSAGPVLRLGLNEDTETSPRRRSLGKSGGLELKRPSQLFAEVQSGRATPQAPVYASTRSIQSPFRTPSSPFRSSMNPASALSSTSLIKSATTSNEEPMRFHPTNPFYSTLPSNTQSASKLPVPNGKTLFASLDRSKANKPATPSRISSESQSNFNNLANSGPSSLPYETNSFYSAHNGSTESFKNTYEAHKDCALNESINASYSHYESPFYESINRNSDIYDDVRTKFKSPFDTSPYDDNGTKFKSTTEKPVKSTFEPNVSTESNTNSKAEIGHTTNGIDPFEKYINAHKSNGDVNYQGNVISKSERESESSTVTRSSTITEHKVNEYEEVKTVKKIIMNGSEVAIGGNTEELRTTNSAAARPVAPPTGSGITTKPPLKSPPTPAPVVSTAASPASRSDKRKFHVALK